jgi:uncharacterized protein YyaL (SSP411 family)
MAKSAADSINRSKQKLLEAATSATQFILDNIRNGEQLFRRYREREASVPGTLEDYTCLIAALLSVMIPLIKDKVAILGNPTVY